MPAYNAGKTLLKTYQEIPSSVVDDIILTDDASQDDTVEISNELNINTLVHAKTKATGPTRKPVTRKRFAGELISSSCSTPITSTRQNSFPPWPS